VVVVVGVVWSCSFCWRGALCQLYLLSGRTILSPSLSLSRVSRKCLFPDLRTFLQCQHLCS
jgi:hypothetical protein